MQTFHEFEYDGKRYRFVYDETHEVAGSFALDTDEETKAAEDEEIRMLESGEWVALGCLVYVPHKPICAVHCGEWEEADSLWGIVVENSAEAAEKFARECM